MVWIEVIFTSDNIDIKQGLKQETKGELYNDKGVNLIKGY